MTVCALVPVEAWHIEHVAANIRACDAAEIWASHHETAGPALELGLRTSVLARTGLVDGVPVCVIGLSPASILTGEGVPWMLATPGLHRVERPFLRLNRPVIEIMQDIFPKLVNYVDARNTATLRWLGWLGFTIDAPAPYGVDGLPFCRFSRTR